MYESVEQYGGFYIGRFETGNNDGKAVVSKGVAPYTGIPWSSTGDMQEDENATTGGAVEVSRAFDSENNYTNVTSTLCYGVQWDAALNFIDPNYITNAEIGSPNCAENSYVRDSSGYGNYSDSDSTNNPGQTGAKDEYSIKNIYDMAGNVREWVMESNNGSFRCYRGGCYSNSGTTYPASKRYNSYPERAYTTLGFRICLFINSTEEDDTEVGEETIPEGLQVGSTVYYNPDGTYLWQSKYCSSPNTASYQQTLDSSSGVFDLQTWKVFDYDEETGEVVLVPEHSTGTDEEGTVDLSGAQGYNNAVKLLNEACSNLYGDEEKGITARSIKVEDFEEKIDKTKLASFQEADGYLGQVTNAYTTNTYYPIIYEKENLACINGSKNNSGLGYSEQDNFIEPTGDFINLIKGESLMPTHTQYHITYSNLKTAFIEKDGVNYKDLLLPAENNTSYWVASRCITNFSTSCNFNIRYVSLGGLSADNLAFSTGNAYSNDAHPIFPVVYLSANLLQPGTETDFIVK